MTRPRDELREEIKQRRKIEKELGKKLGKLAKERDYLQKGHGRCVWVCVCVHIGGEWARCTIFPVVYSRTLGAEFVIDTSYPDNCVLPLKAPVSLSLT